MSHSTSKLLRKWARQFPVRFHMDNPAKAYHALKKAYSKLDKNEKARWKAMMRIGLAEPLAIRT